MPISPDTARGFANAWYAAWNAHDLDAIMALYGDGIEHSSPFIARYNNSSDTWLRGKPAVRAYFARGLEANPGLRFNPKHLTIGCESVVLIYTRHNGDLAAELFALDNASKVVRSISHYDLAPA